MNQTSQKLLNLTMHDGSRHFGSIPQVVDWYQARDAVSSLDGADLTGFLTDNVTEAWIDFAYCDHKFSINDQYCDYWFFVVDPDCPAEILRAVLAHFEALR